MKKLILLFAAVILTGKLFAQAPTPPPLPSREVSGVVKDTADNVIPGAAVTLTSAKDTLKTVTNADGIFVFRNVKMATFFLTVGSLGFQQQTAKRLENDAVPRLVLAPVILKSESRMLKDVVVNGTPAIVYKTDTVEYRASDYKVRENATVEDLIKKMEGIEVGTDGSVTAQGQSIARARLNGKDYIGGDVATVIRDLPAEIVDKIQIVDDYGDMAARTGIKEGDAQKVLNITTLREKSVVNRGRVNAGVGTNDRYQAEVTANRLNGNQQLGLTLTGSQRPSGTSGGGSGGFIGNGGAGGGGRSGIGNQGGGGNQGSGATATNTGGGSGVGTNANGSLRLSHSDTYSSKLKSDLNYTLNYSDQNSSSFTNAYSPIGAGLYTNSNSNRLSTSYTNNINGRLQYDIDSANYLSVSPSFGYSSSTSSSSSSSIQTGDYNQSNINSSNNNSFTPNLGLNIGYQHVFQKRGRNISLGLDYTNSNQNNPNRTDEDITEIRNNVTTYKPLHRLVDNDNISTNYNASLTYSEPLGTYSNLNFNANIRHSVYDNSKITQLVDTAGVPAFDSSLSNVFNYSFTTSNIVLNYRYGGNGKKTSFSLGVRAQPSNLSGFSETRNIAVDRSRFYMVPVFRYQYQWSRTQQMAINYNGNPSEPRYNQIQPVRDDTSPLSPVLGNPNLKASFNHSLSAQYSNYWSNSKLSLQTNLQGTVTQDKVITNRYRGIEDGITKQFTEYLNANGAYGVNANYGISKAFANRKLSIRLNGSAGYNHDIALIQVGRSGASQENLSTTWSFNQRFITQLNPTEWFELNPTFSLNNRKQVNSLPTSLNQRTTTGSFSVDGRVIVKNSYIIGYDASKSVTRGVNISANNNPLIINSYIEKEFFKKKNGVFRIQANDVFNQNTNINRVSSIEGGYSETQVNPISRYFLFSFRWSPSRYGSSSRTQGARRGDGSFIVN